MHPDDRPAVDAAFTRSLTKPVPDTASSIEHRVLMNDGRMKVVEERWQVICDDGGERGDGRLGLLRVETVLTADR